MKITSPNFNFRKEHENLKYDFYRDRIIYIYVVSIISINYIISLTIDSALILRFSINTYLNSMVNVIGLTCLVWVISHYILMIKQRVKSPIIHLLNTIINHCTPIARLVSGFTLLLSINFVLSCYTYIKYLLPEINPYKYDFSFHLIDKFIHFGISPWQLTHFVLAHPIATFSVNFLYNIWFFFIWGVLVFFVFFTRSAHIRIQFFLSFISCWIIVGSVFAVALSSAGPCYIALLQPGYNMYEPLFTLLQQQNQWLIQHNFPGIWSLNTQDLLWRYYQDKTQNIGAGISAMPSMHVSMAVLCAYSISSVSKKWGYIAWLYAGCILIGSVHLGWHYAIDGYVSILLTTLIWKVSGKLVTNCKLSL